MLDIAAGTVSAFYLFDVSDTIDLAAIDGRAVSLPVGAAAPRGGRVAPGYLQFVVPPAIVQLGEVHASGAPCLARIKAYEYGVISLRLTFDAAGPWAQMVALADSGRLFRYRRAPVRRAGDRARTFGRRAESSRWRIIGRTPPACGRGTLRGPAYAVLLFRRRLDGGAVGHRVYLRSSRERTRRRRHSGIRELAIARTAHVRLAAGSRTRPHLRPRLSPLRTLAARPPRSRPCGCASLSDRRRARTHR